MVEVPLSPKQLKTGLESSANRHYSSSMANVVLAAKGGSLPPAGEEGVCNLGNRIIPKCCSSRKRREFATGRRGIKCMEAVEMLPNQKLRRRKREVMRFRP